MKMRVLLIAGLAGFIGVWAMQPEQQPGTAQQSDTMVTLKSSEGQEFKVPEAVTQQSARLQDVAQQPVKVLVAAIQADVLTLIIDLMTQAAAGKTASDLSQYLQSKNLSNDAAIKLFEAMDFLGVQGVTYNAVGQYFAAPLMALSNDPNALSGKIREINNLTAILGLQNKQQFLSVITEQIKSHIPQDLYVKWEQEHVLTERGGVWSVAYSPDGKHIVTVSMQGSKRIWSAQSGRQELELQGLTGGFSLVYSPNGEYVVGAEGMGIRRWNAQTGKEDVEFQKTFSRSGYINLVVYSPDGNHIVTISSDNTARIWNAQTGVLVREFVGGRGLISSIAYSPDGNYLVTGFLDGAARIWNAQTGVLVREFVEYRGGIDSVDYSPDGNHLVTESRDGAARIWNAQTGVLVREFVEDRGWISSVAYSPDGNHLVTGSKDGTVRVWNAQTGAQEHVLTGHANSIRSVAYSPDGNHIVTGSRDKTARIWKKVNFLELIDDFNQALFMYILTQKRAQNPNYGLTQLLTDYTWTFEDEEGRKRKDPWAQKTFNSLPQNFQQFIQEKMPGQQVINDLDEDELGFLWE